MEIKKHRIKFYEFHYGVFVFDWSNLIDGFLIDDFLIDDICL
ncbi:hypothetical protein ACOKFD_06845 [Flagellimonas sp. S174]